MTPKEKAEEIYFKMMKHSFGGDSEQSKQCSLIAVDEIIATIPTLPNDNSKLEKTTAITFWVEVKKELEFSL